MITKFKTYILTLKYLNFIDVEMVVKFFIYFNLLFIIFLW